MSKNIKEVLSSKIFLITIIISIFFIALFFINYAKALSPEYINDYDILIVRTLTTMIMK